MNGLPFAILAVDDDEDDRMFLDEAFKEIGYESELKKFITGEDLLRYLEQVEPSLYPSLIILDNTLPKLQATDLLGLLKNNPLYKNIPVVVYTTAVSPQKKEKLLAMGALDCIEKGTVMSDIVEVAKKLKALAEAHRNNLKYTEK